ncbi:response regulator transcription factor [Membranicola marinus]|uniref:Response regulator transcription factor n=1 Tax=Membranihabitans marinus TaxID=1227546 RepID=A0A953HPU0_9BACT|nr:response regulator transcription factor [Membranihabitans marinus]MBY5959979.1 response regulator transcription factor [Membranihabitans marinus]
MVVVVALDDHPLILEAYTAILSNRSDMTFAGGFTDGKDLLAFLAKSPCDVLILDMHLKHGETGLMWCRMLQKQHPQLKILGVSAFDEFKMIKTFLCAGGTGYILKSAPPKIFTEAILAVGQGKEYLQKELKEILLEQKLKNRSSNDMPPILTSREREVLELIVAGRTTQEIADQLHLSPHTIESHRNNIMSKLNVNNVASMVREAIHKDLVYS